MSYPLRCAATTRRGRPCQRRALWLSRFCTQHANFSPGALSRTPKPKSAAQLEAQCAEWNRSYPVGTLVVYRPVMGSDSGVKRAATRSTAYVMSGHSAVIFLENHPGCVSLNHCEPVTLEQFAGEPKGAA